MPRTPKHIRDLVPDPENVRKHNPRNVEMIERSLNEVGAARSIVSDENNVVLAGNGTIEAAAAAGITKVITVDADGETIVNVRRTGLTPEQKRRLAMYDNRTTDLSGWDPEVLAGLDAEITAGLFTDEELAELTKGVAMDAPLIDAEPQSDRAEELRESWGVKAGQLWQLGEHRLLCGDSTRPEDVTRALGGAEPVLMVTDPPYGVEYDANWRNEADRANGKPSGSRAVGKVANDDRADWREAYALFPGDVVYLWHPAGAPARVFFDSLVACGFEVRMQIIWAKNHFPIGRGHYHVKHEPCYYAVRKGKTAHWIGDRTQNTLWEIDKPIKSDTGHSTQKPLECMARPIANHDSRYVYDPFSGSGTTIMAAESLGRACIAIELEPRYVAVTLQRYLDATGKTPVPIP